MQDHIWIPMALACLFCQAFCDSKNGCTSRKIEIADKKLLLRLNWNNVTGPEILTANSTDKCVQLCCEKNGKCNVAEFHSAMKANNCIHAYCHQISNCLEGKPDKNTGIAATYQLVEVKRGTGQLLINESSEQSKTSQIASRSIKSRKGVGDTEATTNASSREKQADIRTEAPHAEKSLASTAEPESSTVTFTAQPLDLGNATVSSSTETNGTVEATLIEDSTSTTDFPDLDADKMKHVVPRKGASDAYPWVPYSTPASLLQPVDQQPRPPTPTEQISQSDDLPSSKGRNSTEFGINFLKEASITAYGTNLTSSTSQHHENLPKDYDNGSTTSEPAQDFSSEVAQKEQDPKSANTSSKLQQVKLVMAGSIDFLSSRTTVVTAQNLEELHFQQSIYLIVSLIIGFLILLLVIGMVLKHVYGVWERRHYQRMDFLIDGLYNSRSAM